MDSVPIVWIVLIVVLVVAEAATVNLVSIWFALGAVASLIAYYIGAELWLQIVLFFVVSVVALLLTRPLAKRYLNARVQPTNADKVIGAEATVTVRIDNLAGTGMATVSGRLWTARSADGQVIEEGELTVVKAIEGVKIMVVPQKSHVKQTIG